MNTQSIFGPTRLVVLILFLLACPGQPAAQEQEPNATAQEVQRVKNVQDVPQKVIEEGKIPIMVNYDGMDSLGRRMVFQLRERLNGSELFRLSGYKERKIKLFISSQEEFQGRPGLSSIYSLVWTYSYAEDVLSNYLDHQVGIIRANALDELVETLVARTDEISMEYGYLFEE
ncbi:hypothetical protein [Desulfovermiculus halophilus]|uniref:hypothetical protein n=1 Tax=Desulfovermiculus halophilus TaxID=339722 RepID=UPI0006857646|nr:hypothetical protein [Desulfovermiculus halophilus]